MFEKGVFKVVPRYLFHSCRKIIVSTHCCHGNGDMSLQRECEITETHWLPYRQDGTVDDELTSTVKN